MNSDHPAHSHDCDDLELDDELPLGALRFPERETVREWLDEDELAGQTFEQLEQLCPHLPSPFLPPVVSDDSDRSEACPVRSECSPERLGRPIPLERASARSRAAGGNRPKGETVSAGALDFVAHHVGVQK
jgi:hypothetical protein